MASKEFGDDVTEADSVTEESFSTSATRGAREWTAAESVIDLLCDAGIDTFFGLPGGPIIPVFDAILTNPRAVLIEPRHETSGMFEAMGFYRASGRVPAVIVTGGPGATNAVTGAVAASLERVPMIVITGDVPWAATGQRLLQHTGGSEGGIGIDRMLTGVARTVVRVARADSARGHMLAAIRAALDPCNPGPALVVFSVDQSGASIAQTSLYGDTATAPRRDPAVDPAMFERVAREMRRAKRPLLVVGAGCRAAAAKVTALVDALGIPFATTPQAKGIVPEDHPLSLRTLGMGASWWSRKYTRAGVDFALALATDLDDVATSGTPVIEKGGCLVHVDVEPSVFGRNFETKIAASFDVGFFADHLASTVRTSGGAHASGHAIAQAARIGSPFDCASFESDESRPIAPHRAIADLENAAGDDAMFVSDIGEHMLFALHYLTARGPDRFALHLGLGSMGSGIGSAIGHALGNRKRRVVCVCGDGGIQMVGAEILVAIKHRLPIVFAVFNDARYNMVYHGYRYTFGREAAFDTPVVDFVKWAESLGARGVRIDGPGEITRELLGSHSASGLPTVLDVRIDPSIRIKGDGRIEAIRQMSLLHAEAK